MRKLVVSAIVFVLALSVVAPLSAFAAETSGALKAASSAKSVTLTTSYLKGADNSVRLATYDSDAALSSLKSSNKYVVQPHSSNGVVYVTAKKPGKANIAFNLNGTNYVYKLTVKKYSNPLKSLKIAGKNYAAKLKKKRAYKIPGNGWISGKNVALSGKVYVKPNSGWKVSSIKVLAPPLWAKVKNGTTVSKKSPLKFTYKAANTNKKCKATLKSFDGVGVTLVNKKTGVEEYVTVGGNGVVL